MASAASTGDGFEQIYRENAGLVLGPLVRMLRDVDAAEDALQEAVVVALERWPLDGRPANPAGWLLTTARNRARDRLRREAKRAGKQEEAERWTARPRPAVPGDASEDIDMDTVEDDQLRLIFLCCHPALAPDAQVALTLRTLGGLATPEIARAFLVPEATMAQRLVRAKRKIRVAGIPFVLPGPEQLAERLDVVLHVLYLVFNEGYAATSGDVLVRAELCREAIRLARLVAALLPDEPEPRALLALMLLHDSRRAARTDEAGDVVLLGDQDRWRWDHAQIAEGAALVDAAFTGGDVGPYQLEAAVAALHATAPSADATDWTEIAALYAVLARVNPSPVVELNRAVAITMADGAGAGLAHLDQAAVAEALDGSYLFHATRAELLARAGRTGGAIREYQAALALVVTAPERRFLERRLAALIADPGCA
jgi:RNA polymerase sigma-70 factor, ECF subfamily